MLLDETATCIDYVWEAMSVKFVLLAYVLATFLAAEHERKVYHDANSPHPVPQSQFTWPLAGSTTALVHKGIRVR